MTTARDEGPRAGDATLEPAWERRFTAPELGTVRWSAAAPDRLAVVTTEGGLSGAWAWDLRSGERRRVSLGRTGAEEALMTPDGSSVVWWHDPLGDERGRWMVTPFDGGEPRPLLPGVPDAWCAGIAMAPGVVAAGFSTDDDYVAYVARDGGATEVVYRSRRPAGVGCEWPQGEGGLSADGSLLCIRHAERSDIAHPAVRVIDVATGAEVGEVFDPGRTIAPTAWSPIPGDERLVIVRERGDRARPWLWDLVTGALIEIRLDLRGDVARAWWYPGGDALLLHHEHDAIPSLHRLDLATGALDEVVPPGGTINDAGVRPDGAAWYRYDDGATPPSWRVAGTPRTRTWTSSAVSVAAAASAGDASVAVAPPGESAPSGTRWESVRFSNPRGAEIGGWLLRPIGLGPYPTIVSPHGGPEWHVSDRWDPFALAYVDAGLAVFCPNYRGSTGYGAAFRESLRGDIGFPESEDVIAGLEHLVAQGIADPARVFIEGWSWGGYLATLLAGTHPERWRGIVAGIPVGDLVAAHYESAPALQAWDVAIMGGDPMELPGLYHERNPMTYVDRVRAPMLLIAGEHDSRCPLGQVMVYAHALRRRGALVEVHLYPEGHHALRVDERTAQVELILDFFRRCLAAEA
ncbi:MAG: prolyl oligopeptidase family serine peptidase [Chloroflexota bacterium]